MKEAKGIFVTVVSALIVGFGASYLTATATLAKFEERQSQHEVRIKTLERDQRGLDSNINTVTTELRVLNERLKRFDDQGDALKRLERKIDSVLIKK